MKTPIVAIVGRPNVGKSALFNRLCKKRISIIAEEEGVTRDCVYHDTRIGGKKLTLVDTGGIGNTSISFYKQVSQKAEKAIKEADCFVFVVDAFSGVTLLDEEVRKLLFKYNKPIILAVNKIDDVSHEKKVYDFYSLGIENVIGISSIHGYQIEALCRKIVETLPEEELLIEEVQERKMKIAIVGKPNVGKSTLFNALLQEERSIVSDQAGTTRDAVEAVLENYLFIDTAGLKKKCREKELVGKISSLRTYEAIDRSDICIFVLDAREKISVQEKQIARYIASQRKCCILLLNKWDLVKDTRMEHVLQNLYDTVPFLEYCPALCISANARRNIDKIWPLISLVTQAREKKITTPELNKFIENCLQKNHPPMMKGKRFRIYYLTQLHSFPPRFLLFVNDPKLLSKSYEKYLVHQLRLTFGFDGVPLFFSLRAKT